MICGDDATPLESKGEPLRADRLVSILLWLQVHGQTPTAELARRLEVSPRTIHRDMDALSLAGIPVYALRGRRGGWALPEEYRLPSRWLSTEEVQALGVLAPARILKDLGLAGVADAAWLKLLAALPRPHRGEATFVQERVHIDTSAWQPRREAMPWLPALKEAVFREQTVKMRYRRADGDTIDRMLAPLGLVAKGNAWYVVGECEGEIRSYRISRVEAVEIIPKWVERPPAFDLAAFWEESKARLAAGLPRYPVTLRVDRRAMDGLSTSLRWGRIERVEPAALDGWCRVSIQFELFGDALATVLSLGERAVVLTPIELRDAVLASLHATISSYRARDSDRPIGEDGRDVSAHSALGKD